MNETSKSIPRRQRDPLFGKIFAGDGIDIGSGDDWLGYYAEFFPLLRRVDPFDKAANPEHDAQAIKGASRRYDFVHSSHCLEHLPDPTAAFIRWFELVKPGGYLVVIVPDEDLYERGYWPSEGNRDHKATFALCKADSWSPVSINVDEMVGEAFRRFPGEVIRLERLVGSYRFELGLSDAGGRPVDQTLAPAVGECGIEIILRRYTTEETTRRGRFVANRYEKEVAADASTPRAR